MTRVVGDPSAQGDKTPDAAVRTYADIMREQQHNREKEQTMRNVAKKKEEEARMASLDAQPTRAQMGVRRLPSCVLLL